MISILMPAKNTASYLPECLGSILAQTETDWELLAVDDHSADDTFAMLQRHARLDSRIRVFRNDGRGIIDALRLAYTQSKGALITRMDSDDRMSVDKLEEMSKILTEKGRGHIAVGLVAYFSETELGLGYARYADWLNTLTLAGGNFRDIYKECVIPSPCWMMAREDLDICGAFRPNDYPEDYDLCFRWKKAGMQVAGIPKILHHWRDHPQRASRNDPHYLDNRFTEMKIRYFAELDYDARRGLYLWGAGKKGKSMAQVLQKYHIPFRWVCNNPKKIGRDIYGVRMEHYSSVEDEGEQAQVLVSVSSPSDLEGVSKWLREKGVEAWWTFG